MGVKRNRESIIINPRKYDLSGFPTDYFNPGELSILLDLYEFVGAKVIVEFGCNNGRTAAAALRNMPSINRYIGIDVTHDYVTNMPCQRREVPTVPGELALQDPRFELIVKPRGGFDLDSIPKCDAVFIDADHSKEGVLNDYFLAKKAVRNGGIIIFHDDNCLPVVQVTETLDELVRCGADIKHVKDTWLSFEVQK
jgi:predicted O-methyltransferase YrrM